jgi:hypothetical protein
MFQNYFHIELLNQLITEEYMLATENKVNKN